MIGFYNGGMCSARPTGRIAPSARGVAVAGDVANEVAAAAGAVMAVAPEARSPTDGLGAPHPTHA